MRLRGEFVDVLKATKRRICGCSECNKEENLWMF
jgi:hypothetical protein